MSTRSIIAIKNSDGTYKSVYCHSDGYPSYNGRMLKTYYNTEAQARALISLGGISIIKERLAPNPGERHGFEYDERAEGVTVAYHRDRKEPLEIYNYNLFGQVVEAAKDCCAAFVYLFKDGKWYYSSTADLSKASYNGVNKRFCDSIMKLLTNKAIKED